MPAYRRGCAWHPAPARLPGAPGRPRPLPGGGPAARVLRFHATRHRGRVDPEVVGLCRTGAGQPGQRQHVRRAVLGSTRSWPCTAGAGRRDGSRVRSASIVRRCRAGSGQASCRPDGSDAATAPLTATPSTSAGAGTSNCLDRFGIAWPSLPSVLSCSPASMTLRAAFDGGLRPSWTPAARDRLSAARSGRRNGRFRSNQGMAVWSGHAGLAAVG